MKLKFEFSRVSRPVLFGAIAVALASSPQNASADESGISFWVPGQFGSLAAAPTAPGWSLGTVYYRTSVAASGAAAAAREVQVGRFSPNVNVSLNVNLNAPPDLLFLAPTYTFATPVLGGQLAIGVTGVFGRNSTTLDGALTAGFGPFATMRTGSTTDSLTGFGDLYPMITLKWHDGVHNYMTYATGDIPVGAYDPSRLSNIGIGHGAIDAGGGYTCLFSTRLRGMNSQASRDLLTTSRIQIRRFRAASISISIGACRNFSRSRPSSVLSDMPISKSPTIPADCPPSAASGTGSRCGSAVRLHFSDRRHAGIFEYKGIWRIRRGEPAVGLEYLADLCDLAYRA
ncbi:hypothetical protein ABIB94_009295 [Bradyrhizobium sp. JR7.2]